MLGFKSPPPYLIPLRNFIYFLFLQKQMMASGSSYFWYFHIMVLALNKLDCCSVYAFNLLFYDFFPEGVIPYKRLLGMCRWMGSHFHDWTDYNGVTFLVELLEWSRIFSRFLG